MNFPKFAITIECNQKNQYNPTRPVYDSYTFEVVNGINVYNFEQFLLNMREKNPVATVLQNDASITSALIKKYSVSVIEITADIYGNGYLLSAHGLNQGEYKFKIEKIL